MRNSLKDRLVTTARQTACAALAVSLGLAAAAPAHATDFVFDFTKPNSGNMANNQTASVNNNVVDSGAKYATTTFTRTTGGESLVLQLSAWSIDTSPNPDKTYNAVMQFWSGGVGVLNDYENNSEPKRRSGESNSSPDHAIDNDNGNIDFLVLQFSKPVNLTSINLGWIYNDSDATINWGDAPGAWNALPVLDNKTITGAGGLNSMIDGILQAPGGNKNADLGLRATPNGGLSDFWIISAANPNLREGNDKKAKADYFKLSGIVVSEYPPLPEPGTWMMMIVGFGAIGGTMRRRRKFTGAPETLALR